MGDLVCFSFLASLKRFKVWTNPAAERIASQNVMRNRCQECKRRKKKALLPNAIENSNAKCSYIVFESCVYCSEKGITCSVAQNNRSGEIRLKRRNQKKYSEIPMPLSPIGPHSELSQREFHYFGDMYDSTCLSPILKASISTLISGSCMVQTSPINLCCTVCLPITSRLYPSRSHHWSMPKITNL